MIWCSLTWREMKGKHTRMKAAANANAPKMPPTTDALYPRSCPSTGTTKVCTSQHEDSNQLTPSKRRIMGSASKSKARRGASFANSGDSGNSGTRRIQNHVNSGNSAIDKNAHRKPTTSAATGPAKSINNPAKTGPTKFDTAGPKDNQLKATLSAAASLAMRPTCRCKAITAMPVAPPAAKALKHITGKIGQIAERKTPEVATTTLKRMSFCRPRRSLYRPAGRAKNIGARANKANKAPTATGLKPCLRANKGMAIRTPAMQACRNIWPAIKRAKSGLKVSPLRAIRGHRAAALGPLTRARHQLGARPCSSCCCGFALGQGC